MVVESARLFHLLKFAAPAVILLWSLGYLAVSRPGYREFLRQFKDERKLFAADFLEHEIDGRFNGRPIAELCESKIWTPGLVLSCEPPGGGVGEVKNAHLHCIRIAIEMGAELVLPDIVQRSESELATPVPKGPGPRRGVPLDYFFDRQHLNDTLSTYCLQLKLYSSMNDLYDVPSLLQSIKLSIGRLSSDVVHGTILAKPERLGKQIKDYLDRQSPPPRRKYPFHVHLDTPTFTFPTAFDPVGFAANFGRVLRVRQDARELAASALFNMKKMFDLDLDPRNGIDRDSFMGVHLQTEQDVTGVFPAYETQAADYLYCIAQNKIRLAFLATGAAAEDVSLFAERAKDFNATTVTKKDVLGGEDLRRLERLSWDQRGLVDYEVMLRAGLIAGTAESSFAWNLAIRRSRAYGVTNSTQPRARGGNVRWQDQYSVIFGHSEAGESMQLSIWA